jgi:hypothetical protein
MKQVLMALAVTCVLVVIANAHDLNPREYKLGEWGKVTIENDPQCVAASELMGRWVLHSDLTTRLTHEERPAPFELTFSGDPQSRQRVVAAVERHFDFLEKNTGKDVADWLRRDAQTAYLAGACELHAGKTIVKSDFLLIASAATPHLILLMDGQLQSCNVMLARDAGGDNDLLFIGDDTNTNSFKAYERKK